MNRPYHGRPLLSGVGVRSALRFENTFHRARLPTPDGGSRQRRARRCARDRPRPRRRHLAEGVAPPDRVALGQLPDGRTRSPRPRRAGGRTVPVRGGRPHRRGGRPGGGRKPRRARRAVAGRLCGHRGGGPEPRPGHRARALGEQRRLPGTARRPDGPRRWALQTRCPGPVRRGAVRGRHRRASPDPTAPRGQPSSGYWRWGSRSTRGGRPD